MSSSKTTYDLIAIGTGVAASTVAGQCHSAGWKIAVIDSRPFGGTCALRGCDPKKVLVGIAELIDWDHRMEGKGVNHAKGVSGQSRTRYHFALVSQPVFGYSYFFQHQLLSIVLPTD
jgi:pyruvate/2-oxoglutarate dehydrogenase complex dihydrolipoamide dehydrogenase (E3) component